MAKKQQLVLYIVRIVNGKRRETKFYAGPNKAETTIESNAMRLPEHMASNVVKAMKLKYSNCLVYKESVNPPSD